MYPSFYARRHAAAAEPVLSNIITIVETDPRESTIRTHVKAVAAYYKDDELNMLGFWFQSPDVEYDFTSEVHLRNEMGSLHTAQLPTPHHALFPAQFAS
jgi:hypothetical protein